MKKIRFWAISVAISLLKEPHIHHHEFSVRILTENAHRSLAAISTAVSPNLITATSITTNFKLVSSPRMNIGVLLCA